MTKQELIKFLLNDDMTLPESEVLVSTSEQHEVDAHDCSISRDSGKRRILIHTDIEVCRNCASDSRNKLISVLSHIRELKNGTCTINQVIERLEDYLDD